MRAIVCLGVALAVGASSAQDIREPAVDVCEAYVQKHLLAPATYRRHAVSVAGELVELEFDSQNVGGALVRSGAKCRFREDFGMFYLEQDPYWDWLSCETTGRPESPGTSCDAIATDWMLFGLELRSSVTYPIPRSETSLLR